jgi:bifunctional non-homologous end joining protein LigD
MLDPSRNGTGATVVAPYSPRIRPDGTVSFPVTPEELRRVRPEDFTLATAAALANERAGPRAWDALAGRASRLPRVLLED